MIDLVLASTNRHKYEELSAFFRSDKAFYGICLHGSDDFPMMAGEIEETGNSYEENAFLKASEWANFTGLPAIADDSGLEVRALGWEPGIYSARAVSGADSNRIKWLLGRMNDVSDRRACFVASLVIVPPGIKSENEVKTRDYFVVEGRCWGNIAYSPAGSSGFGYDPVFIPDGYNMTFAELGEAVKSRISHRSIAVQGLAKIMHSVVKYFAVYGSQKQKKKVTDNL